MQCTVLARCACTDVHGLADECLSELCLSLNSDNIDEKGFQSSLH